jgi:hypothetical protein
MARTEITPTDLTPNAALAEPAATTIDAALVTAGVAIIGASPLEEIFVLVEHTAAAEYDLTVAVGDNPPADAAGQGALVTPFAAGNVTPVRKLLGPFTSARFIQSGAETGQLFINFETNFAGTMWVYHMPRTA